MCMTGMFIDTFKFQFSCWIWIEVAKLQNCNSNVVLKWTRKGKMFKVSCHVAYRIFYLVYKFHHIQKLTFMGEVEEHLFSQNLFPVMNL